MQRYLHPGDHLLLLAMDGELPRRRQARIETHVATCATCRTQLRRLESVLADVNHAYRLAGDATPPSTRDARLRLERALRRAGEEWDRPWWVRLRDFMALPPNTVPIAATSLFVVLVAWLSGGVGVPWSRGTLAVSGDSLPVAALTPGAVSTLTAGELCAGTRASRVVPDQVRRYVLAGYGMERTPTDAYELDALITPELGGTTARENLWPQRYASPVWNAHVKDALEQLFAERVCNDAMTLAQAQRELATDWVAAYKRHFQTETPIRAHALATPDDDDLLYESSPPAPSMARLFVNVRLTLQ